jgi:hypothetical protein
MVATGADRAASKPLESGHPQAFPRPEGGRSLSPRPGTGQPLTSDVKGQPDDAMIGAVSGALQTLLYYSERLEHFTIARGV